MSKLRFRGIFRVCDCLHPINERFAALDPVLVQCEMIRGRRDYLALCNERS